ncbi:MAG: hypothetical protein JW860_16445 [Sedimentisphaerales bacterium]|nr:hypothetical protein [Sedimentisphaerales bacterium]
MVGPVWFLLSQQPILGQNHEILYVDGVFPGKIDRGGIHKPIPAQAGKVIQVYFAVAPVMSLVTEFRSRIEVKDCWLEAEPGMSKVACQLMVVMSISS